jgi:hypothetical protein
MCRRRFSCSATEHRSEMQSGMSEADGFLPLFSESEPGAGLECLRGMQQNRHRAFVRLDFHRLLKAASFATNSGGADLFDEEVIEPARFCACGVVVERRALAASHVSIERELGNCRDGAANLLHAAIHFSSIVFKAAHAGDFSGEIRSVGLSVVAANAKQDEPSRANFPRDLAVRGNLSVACALDYGWRGIRGRREFCCGPENKRWSEYFC